MFFETKPKRNEVIKWGIYSGGIMGIFIFLFILILINRSSLLQLANGWEKGFAYMTLILFTSSAVVSTVIILAHPLYSVLQRRYMEALLTFLVTVAVMILWMIAILWGYQLIPIV